MKQEFAWPYSSQFIPSFCSLVKTKYKRKINGEMSKAMTCFQFLSLHVYHDSNDECNPLGQHFCFGKMGNNKNSGHSISPTLQQIHTKSKLKHYKVFQFTPNRYKMVERCIELNAVSFWRAFNFLLQFFGPNVSKSVIFDFDRS